MISNQTFYNKRILIVEDDKQLQEVLSMFLKNYMAEIIFADNGIEAVELFQKTTFNLILMDISMPELDGIQATTIIKNIDSSVPIVIISVYSNPEIINECLKAGADEFVSKPFSLNNLDTIIRKYIY